MIREPGIHRRVTAANADIDPLSAVGPLGLKLVPQKAQVDVIAVDHVERPSEN